MNKKTTPAPADSPATPDLKEQVEHIRSVLDNKKAEDIAVLHVTDVSSVSDYMILCSGLNPPHLRALADEVIKQRRLETPPEAPRHRAGSVQSEWMVLDYGDIVIHFFTPAMRAYYALEQLWKDAPKAKGPA